MTMSNFTNLLRHALRWAPTFGLLFAFAPPCAAEDAIYDVGVAKIDVTPGYPIRLNGFGGRREDTEAFYGFTSYNLPTTLYHYDFASGRSEVFRQAKVAFDPAAFEVKEVFYPSKDGTRIPLFLAYRKGLKLDGQNPTLLYGYGGFDITINPTFSASRIAFTRVKYCSGNSAPAESVT